MRSGFGNISSAWSIWLWVITMFFYWRTTYHSFWSWSHDLRPILKLPSVDLTHQKQKKQSSINVDLAHHEQTRISRLFSYKTYHHPLWCWELPRSGTSDNLLRRTAERDFIRRGVVTVSFIEGSRKSEIQKRDWYQFLKTSSRRKETPCTEGRCIEWGNVLGVGRMS